MAFSPDGRLLAGAGGRVRFFLWDPATGKPADVQLNGHTGTVHTVTFNHDGTLLASAGPAGVLLWDPATGKPADVQLNGHTGTVHTVAFNHDGTLLASAGPAGVLLWDPATGESAEVQFDNPTGEAYKVAFSAHGDWLAVLGRDAKVRLWNPATGDRAQYPAIRAGTDDEIGFMPRGHVLVTSGSSEGVDAIRLWNAATGAALDQPLRDQDTGATYAMAISPDGPLVATAGGNQKVQLWVCPVEPRWAINSGDTPETSWGWRSAPMGSDSHPMTPTVQSGSGQSTPKTSRARHFRRTLTASPPWPSHHKAGSSPRPEALRPVAGRGCGTPRPAKLSASRSQATQERSLAFSPSGNLLAVGGSTKLGLWNPVTGERHGQPLGRRWSEVSTVSFSPDGDLLASGPTSAQRSLSGIRQAAKRSGRPFSPKTARASGRWHSALVAACWRSRAMRSAAPSACGTQ